MGSGRDLGLRLGLLLDGVLALRQRFGVDQILVKEFCGTGRAAPSDLPSNPRFTNCTPLY